MKRTFHSEKLDPIIVSRIGTTHSQHRHTKNDDSYYYSSSSQVMNNPDILQNILSYSDATTLSTCSGVSREWKTLASKDSLWKDLCKVNFGICPNEIIPPPDPAKLLYVWTHKCFRESFKATRRRSGNPIAIGGSIHGPNLVVPRSVLSQLHW